MSALHAFPGGLCLPANKERSTALPIQQAPLAQRYIRSTNGTARTTPWRMSTNRSAAVRWWWSADPRAPENPP